MDNARDPWLESEMPDLYMTMIETAETVADRYGISRERKDEYELQSQMRTARAQRNGFMDDDIVPFKSTMKYYDKENDKPYVGFADKGEKGISTGSIVNLAPAMEIIGLSLIHI